MKHIPCAAALSVRIKSEMKLPLFKPIFAAWLAAFAVNISITVPSPTVVLSTQSVTKVQVIAITTTFISIRAG